MKSQEHILEPVHPPRAAPAIQINQMLMTDFLSIREEKCANKKKKRKKWQKKEILTIYNHENNNRV